MRIATPYAFALMARVYPSIDAFRVLQLTEEIDNLPKLAGFMAGVVAFALRLPPLQIALIVFIAVAVFRLVHLFGLFIPPFTLFLPLSRVYSVISGYGVLLVALLVFGFLTVGWRGVLAFLAARACCGVLFWPFELAWSRRVHRLIGFPSRHQSGAFFMRFD